MNEVTRIINAIEAGEAGATEKLLPLVYEELRILAAQKMAQEKPGQTLQATALVHEAYLRLVGSHCESWDSRGHFFAAAAEAMRRILVETARAKRGGRRGGKFQRIQLSDSVLAIDEPCEDIIVLDEALAKLGEEEEIVAELVKLRYFAGLPLQQVAEILGISRRTAYRHWAYARAWLYQAISESREAEAT